MSHEESIYLTHVEKAWKLVDHYCQEAAQPWKDNEQGLAYVLPPETTIHIIKPWIDKGISQGLPTILKEKFKTSKRIRHGSFPEIRRAWAILDDSLFMWSFDPSGGDIWLYGDEGKPVIDVGLVKPQPGFMEDVEFLMVWVTPLKLLVSKVLTSEDGAKRLERMIVYKSSTDGVRMSCLLCSSKGRIFVAGQDGHIYELIYTFGTPYRLQCCTPIAATSFFNRFFFGADDHVVEMVVDNQRRTLYTRTKKGKLVAYFLGMNGDSSFVKVGEVWSLYFAPVVCISPLSKLESKWSHAHLVTVFSDGRRRFLSTSSSDPETPDCLRTVTEKRPPLLDMKDIHNNCRIQVVPAYSSLGTLVLSYPSPDNISAHVFLVGKDSSSYTSTLREITYSFRFDGRVLFASEVLPTPDATSTMVSLYSQVLGESYENTCSILRGRGDLLTQHLLPEKEILLFTTTSMVQLFFNRPVDILNTMLIGRMYSINVFVSYWGADETAAMCLMLASRIMLGAGELDSLVPTRAADIFEGMKLEIMPQLNARMAQDEFVHSAAHKGLYLCTSRLLYPLWNSCILSKRSSSDIMPDDGVVICPFPADAMHELQSKLRSLGKYLIRKSDAEDSSEGELANVRQGLPDAWNEDVHSMECCRHLIIRSAEALFLLQTLSRHDIAIYTWECEESLRRTLLQLEFRQLVHSEDGDQIAKVLISAIMKKEPLGSSTREILLEGCPSYSKEALVDLPSHSEEALAACPSHTEEAISLRRKWRRPL